MNIAFRVDASLRIGTGHAMRCLALANALRESGASCHFLCREQEGNEGLRILKAGHKLHFLRRNASSSAMDNKIPAASYGTWLEANPDSDADESLEVLGKIKPDWLVLDHYALDARWEKAALPENTRLLVIDDLANRSHIADILLDQNAGRTLDDYSKLIPHDCRKVIGPLYALLRPEFRERREASLKRRMIPQLENILVTMGGVDAGNFSEAALEALESCGLSETAHINVVLGSSSPWKREVTRRARNMRYSTSVLVGPESMSELMCQADIAIGAAGSTSWERCCLGLPTIAVMVAENQRAGLNALARESVILVADKETLATDIAGHMKRCQHSPDIMRKLSERSAALVDGLGAQRVAALLEG